MDTLTDELQTNAQAFLASLSADLRGAVLRNEPMWKHTTMRVGGPADLFFRAESAEALAAILVAAQESQFPFFLLGGGSNICVSDHGVRGLVIQNVTRGCSLGEITHVDTGYAIMDLFLRTAGAGLSGLEFAVGIPGSVGGALVSNAGAYRENIADRVMELDVVEDARRQTVEPDWMGFSYRDSRLRRGGSKPAAVVSVKLQLTPKPRAEILAKARENQRQRIYKQPWYPSAGSFFKNVYDRELAARLPDLPPSMKEAGVVPAGFLNSACGCKGLTVGGAQISRRHGNFVVNRGNATAADIRQLADLVRERVHEKFGVVLHEEVLYVGEW